MTQAVLHQILEQMKTLGPSELRQVSRAVRDQLSTREEAQQHQKLHRALIASGLVRQIKEPASGPGPERRLVQVTGEPVSQTILNERR